MSVYSISVTGPSARLAMLRALAIKSWNVLGDQLASARLILGRATRLAKATASAALAVLGSPNGYGLVRRGLRTILTSAARIIASGVRLARDGITWVGHFALAGVEILSPTTAEVIDEYWHQWAVRPVTAVTTAISAWLTNVLTVVWDLSDTGLVKGVTIKVAQAAGLMLAVHSLTSGAVAAKVVMLIPTAMSAVVFLTDPGKVLAVVGIVFVSAMVVAGLRVLDRPSSPDPEHVGDGELLDSGAPALLTGPRHIAEPDYDLVGIASRLQVEVAADGSVLVHGIPAELPESIGLEVAHVAADAATARLERILLHRASPNRDDRRVITKIAREAVRAHARRIAAA